MVARRRPSWPASMAFMPTRFGSGAIDTPALRPGFTRRADADIRQADPVSARQKTDFRPVGAGFARVEPPQPLPRLDSCRVDLEMP